jgi:type III restriction enzyme
VRILLKDFQVQAVETLVSNLRLASAEVSRAGHLQAVSLSAPTGSGKTVIATAAIERLLDGDGESPPLRDALFLWITDLPELNEQTRRKMLDVSSTLGPAQLVTIDSTFDEERLAPGRVYFLNTQKLGRDRRLVSEGDERHYTIWDTLSNTAESFRASFYVIIDEAHRGMQPSPAAQRDTTTIIQRFIGGFPGSLPAITLIAGISATPQRFLRILGDTTRTTRRVEVTADDVRSSGLLKEVISLYHPTQAQPADITMLRAAAREWRKFSTEWAEYCAAQNEPAVVPVLVVQVQDGNELQISRTNLAEAWQAINDEAGPLADDAFAHAFQEGQGISVADKPLRYVSPSDIVDDPDVRVVFFKTSLNTGWDCPRAEVMMSFRAAADSTHIAQLVGRMVRTPLARRIDANEYLNTVALFLPHYDSTNLQRVLNDLQRQDPELTGPVRVQPGEDTRQYRRAPDLAECFEALRTVTSFVIPRATRTSQVKRLLKLSRLLANDGLEPDATERATSLLLDVLRDWYVRLRETPAFIALLAESAILDVRTVNWHVLGGEQDEASRQIALSAENLDDLFDHAGRKLGEGLHKAYWRMRAREDPAARGKAKLETFGLAATDTVIAALENSAKELVNVWLERYASQIEAQPERSRQSYDDIRGLASDPEKVHLTSLPDVIEARATDSEWQKHLYSDLEGNFYEQFNTWETLVLRDELEKPEVIGWLRNPSRKDWALSIPYEQGGETKAMYPDFLVFRRVGEQIRVDLLDPHDPGLEDAPAKAVGLAKYAADHGLRFGRIELILVEDSNVRRLDLKNADLRDRVKRVTSTPHLRDLILNS